MPGKCRECIINMVENKDIVVHKAVLFGRIKQPNAYLHDIPVTLRQLNELWTPNGTYACYHLFLCNKLCERQRCREELPRLITPLLVIEEVDS
jgi:hypothetical protein